MADPSHPVPSSATSISFSFLSSEEIRRISVKQITEAQLFDNVNNPTLGGLYDPALGPTKKGDICTTCRLSSFDCPGHFGHIDLPTPVFHPLFMTQTYNLLRGSCNNCHHFLMPPALLAQYSARLLLLERGLVTESDELEQVTIKAHRPPSKGTQEANVEERGDSTGETVPEYKARLWKHITNAVKRVRARGDDVDRDAYKSAICFDKRKALIQEFLKATVKKRCANCGAHHHRMRKEGHTKIIEYSLTPKQQMQDEQMGIQRKNILITANQSKARSALKRPKKNGSKGEDGATARQLRHDSDAESREGYNVDQVDSDADSDDPEAPNGRAATPASSSDDDDQGSEAPEDNTIPMDLDEEEEAELQADLADVSLARPPPSTTTNRAKQTERIMTSEECRLLLRELFKNESEICGLLYSPHGPIPTEQQNDPKAAALPAPHLSAVSSDMFFIDVLAVPPSRFRPAATLGDMMFESPQNELLSNVLKATLTIRDRNNALREATTKKPPGTPAAITSIQQDPIRLYAGVIEAMLNLQVCVNSLIDSTKNPMIVRGGKEPPAGIKQVLEKKEGLFRKNMMGKRVNYAARSVISPDINIETNEIGVPPVFAKKLTFPEPVTPHNVRRLMQNVINGPKVHPGASYIQMEDGHLLSLEKMSLEERQAKAQQLLTPSDTTSTSGRPDVGLPSTRTQQINRKVYRHLDDGDILILNRQPTLHKPSMMCHKAKILRGEKTIRMHYANCNSYNADFDGDEMNMHFPQSYLAQAEARMIANTDNQYLVPTSGNPLRGLIQDHVVAGTWMTNKDTFFTRDEYYQLIYGALRPENNYSGGGRVRTLPPAVWKPKPRWTGKQIISTIMLNVTPEGAKGLHMASKAKVPGSAWGKSNEEEGTVQFFEGDMITGTLDKSQFGATSYGLVHSCYELYGAEVGGKLLGILSRLFTKYLQHRAFTCRMDDLLLTKEGNKVRADLIKEADERGYMAALQVVGLDKEKDLKSAQTKHNLNTRLEEVLRDDNKLAGLDAVVSSKMGELTSQAIKATLPGGLVKPFPHNHMQTMTISGAKGSNVNASQISCMLGQQSLEGRRVPTMVSGKTLPSFKAFETAPRAGGYVAQRFLTGIRPQEYYFHCMAGREGLIDTAVKTSRSGYLQRCLIKHLEGIKVNYDHTVRNADQSVIQFHYGEDSLDVTKQKSLLQFEFATRNYESLVNRYNPANAIGKIDESEAVDHMKRTLREVAGAHLADATLSLEGQSPLPDPTLSLFSPSKYMGSVSEAYAAQLGDYIAKNPQKLLKSKKKDRKTWHEWCTKNIKDDLIELEDFRLLMAMRYMRSLVDPGEAVGLLASQGVGEPSTQMTLNTFHFAGHGAANVTLGIPRLREIVMTASASIKTPTMKLEVQPSVTDEHLNNFCKEASKVTLSQIVEEVTVEEKLSSKLPENAYSREKMYTIKMKFYPRAEYEEEFRTNPEQILRSLDRSFIPLFDKEVHKALKTSMKTAKLSDVGKAQKVGGKGPRTETGDDLDGGDGEGAFEDDMAAPTRREDGEEFDGDADDARRAKQTQDESDADSDEDDGEDDDGMGLPKDADALEAAFADDSDEDDGEKDSDDDDSSDVGSDDIDGESAALDKRSKKVEKQERKERFTKLEEMISSRSKYIQAINFDKSEGEYCHLDLQFSSKQPKLLLVGIVEACCRAAVVHQAPKISRCFVAAAESGSKPGDPRYCLTEGVNLAGTWSFADGIANMDTIYTNDIAAMLRTYGVEAARSVLIKEVQGVFNVYGIAVDRRHLTLIADYMTSEGGYKPFNRTGLANSPSPFLKASFETTATFISDAALYGDYEDLTSPSASIVLGKIAHTGTGVFDVAMPLVSPLPRRASSVESADGEVDQGDEEEVDLRD